MPKEKTKKIKNTFFLFFLAFFLFPFFLFSEGIKSNVGIINGLWFSKTNPLEGERFKVYTAVFNNTDSLIKGEVVFLSNKKVFSQKNFEIKPEEIKKLQVELEAEAPRQLVEVKINQAYELKGDGKSQKVNVLLSESQNLLNVDFDSDKDGIGNRKDPDDDNDGFTDIEEKKAGTDPLNNRSFPEEKKAVENLGEKTLLLGQKIAEKIEQIREKSKEKIDEEIKKAEEKTKSSQEERVGNENQTLTKNSSQKQNEASSYTKEFQRENEISENGQEEKSFWIWTEQNFAEKAEKGYLSFLKVLSFIFSSPWLFLFFLLILSRILYKILKRLKR